MIERKPSVQDIDWFNDLLAFQRINLDPLYQRYSVWSKSYKQYFIDTIINNYPSPAIFLQKETISPIDHIYNVVDGKQRLTTIFEFQKNEFSLPKDHDLFPGRYFDELPPNIQTSFRNYQIPIETLSTQNTGYLREVFDRLNRNVRKLNKQELRYARHDGPFIKMIETLAKDPFWFDIDISTPSRLRSMRDVEFVSEIFILSAHGIQDSSYKILDNYYAIYDDEETFEKVKKHRGTYEGCITIMKRLKASFLSQTRFNNLNDFYSLWATMLDYADRPDAINYEETRTQLQEFSERVTSPEDIPLGDKLALRYSDAVRQGTNKLGNRRIRSEILKNFIKKTK